VNTIEARILMLEDVEMDAMLSRREFERAGITATYRRVETREDFEAALVEFQPDVVLSDFTLPEFDGLSALRIARALLPGAPFIFVSGTIGEDRAVEALHEGATDYVLKHRLERLVPVVTRAIQETKTRSAQRKAEHSLRLTQFAVDHAHGGVLRIGADGKLQYANESACRMLGRLGEDLLALHIREIDSRYVPGAWPQQWEELKAQGTTVFESQYRRGDGKPLPVEVTASYIAYESGEYVFFYASDLTERKAAEERIRYLANYDALTGLPNRNLLLDRLRQALHLADRYRLSVAVLFVGLDRFKLVNDTLGYAAGDELLKLAGAKLTECVRAVDTAARIGGDEFAVVLSGSTDEESDGTARAAQRILEAFAQPAVVEGRELFVTCSVGVAMYPDDGDDPEALLRNSSVALYRAKDQGRNTYQLYTAANGSHAPERLSLETGLRRALEREELCLHYQPQVSLGTGEVVGLEALLRWSHPEMGLISPARFIPIAEETGLILPISEWVLQAACAQSKAWQAQGFGPLRTAVNISWRQFRQKDLAAKISSTLARTGLEPDCLDLELTEGTLVQNVETAIRALDELKRLGVHISLDDFGTGYSSLNYLKRLPIDVLKIDQSFVREITNDPDSAAIANAIIAMAHSMRLRVIAEGVETMGQLALLHRRGCDQIQGFLFSKPLPPEELTRLLRDRPSLAMPAMDTGQQTLLLVDDEAKILSALKRSLRGQGYRILAAESAKAGFELLAQNDVQVILSDSRMPEMNGVEFFERVKDLYPETVRIMLSGYTELQAVTDAINRGAVYKFLTKPWEDDRIREEIRDAFHRSGGGKKQNPEG
jgi:diguanylate cyclase (GGDEF)-like protein/PAS domain S-box-containing protein